MQPSPPAGAACAAALDDHVADLAGGAAAEPGLAVEDQPAADAGSPEDAEDQSRTPCPAPSWNSASIATGRRCRSGPRCPERSFSVLPEREASRSSRAGCGRRRRPRSSRRRRRGSRLRRRQSRACRARPARPPRASRPPSPRRRPPGPPLVGVGRRDCPSTSFCASTTTVWILVPPRSMPPRAARLLAGLTVQTISVGSEGFGKL